MGSYFYNLYIVEIIKHKVCALLVIRMKRHFITILFALCSLLAIAQQDRQVQYKPYIDLRPMHFGILIGLHLQDLEFDQTGPFQMPDENGDMQQQYLLCDADRWAAGFSVGVLGELRLSNHFSLRVTPTMHFGAKHLTLLNMNQLDEKGNPIKKTQDMKNTYISLPIDLKFAAPRWNNYRPYIMAGVNGMMNLTNSDQDMIHVKRLNTMLEVGMGCDFYLPFFKFIPELKFCFGLSDVLDKNHVNDLRDNNLKAYANSVCGAQSKMVVLTFYFE